MWNVLFYLTLLVLTTSYAFWRGGAPERIVAGITLAAVAASIAVVNLRFGFTAPNTAILVIDLVMFIAILAVALFAERYWPIWMAAFLGVGFELQFAMWAAPEIHTPLYRVLHLWNSYPTLLLLFLGTRRHQQRLARLGADPSWSAFWSRWSWPMRSASPPA